MLFTILLVGGFPLAAKNRAFLLTDNWDHWAKFSTMYRLIIRDSEGEQRDVGRDALMSARVQFHFHVFALGELYSMFAADVISCIASYFKSLFKASVGDGANQVREHLAQQASSAFLVNLNGWRAQLY